MPAATSLLAAAALAASGSAQLGLRSEVRGIEGGPPGQRIIEPVPYEIDPTVILGLELDQPLALDLAYTPRILLLAGPDGGYAVRSASHYQVGSASAGWRPDDRLRLSITGSVARGILETSPLAQLSAPAAPGQPAPSPDPSAGLRSGRHAAESLGGAIEWRATQNLTLGGSAGYARSGGANQSARLIFPPREDLSAGAHAGVAATTVDRLGIDASLARTRLAGMGAVSMLGLGSRWDRQFSPNTSGSLGAGLTATVEDSTHPVSTSWVSRLSPQVEASIAQKALADRPGLGANARVSYAPYVDQYVARVRQRLAARADLDWLAAERLRITAGFGGATAVGAGRLGPGLAAAELAFWSRQPAWEIGLVLRGGYEEGEVPGGTIWQWGVALAARSAFRQNL